MTPATRASTAQPAEPVADAVWPEPPPRRHPWIGPVAVGLGALAATIYTGVLDPNTSHAFPLCPLKAATGVDCPMCGGLRAVHSLTHGDVIGAADHNLLVVLLLPVALYWYACWLGRSLGHRMPTPSLTPRVVAIGFAVMTLFAVARNLPVPGHDFLNSTALLAGRSA